MKFAKMQGLGNDFIVVDDRDGSYAAGAEGAVRLCDRRLGIGADGLLLLRRSLTADIGMFLYNSDGSPAGMCGNGIRCLARYAREKGIVPEGGMTIETPAGIRAVRIKTENGAAAAEADMGKPLFDRPSIPMLGEGEFQLETLSVLGREFTCSAVNTGVPHLTVFVNEGFSTEEVLRYGPALERCPLFPARTNVDFAAVIDRSHISLRTWERGCGLTPACGTGSCAAAVCAARARAAGRQVSVSLGYGSLEIDWAPDGRILMSGPAEFVYEGETAV